MQPLMSGRRSVYNREVCACVPDRYCITYNLEARPDAEVYALSSICYQQAIERASFVYI